MCDVFADHDLNIRQRETFDQKLTLGLVIDKKFHEQNRWCSATTFYLVEALKKSFDCVYIETQSDYEEKIGSLEALISMEPGWAAPVLEFAKTNSLKEKLSNIPSYIIYSDPHANHWRQDYFLDNGLDFVLSYYYYPFKYHFKRIPDKNFIHFPWAIPDQWISESKVTFNGNSKISCFGGHKSQAYSLRNWCRSFPFVASSDNSGVENKVMTDAEYLRWLGQKDAAIAAGSDEEKYLLTVPKYFEIPAAGALLFAQKTDDLNLLGFKNMDNCIIFERSSFEKLAKDYLSHPEDYLDIRRAGRELIRRRHTLSGRINFLAKHIEMIQKQKNKQIKSFNDSYNKIKKKNKSLNQHTLETKQKLPKILFIVDRPGWAHDIKTDCLISNLGDDYDMIKRYKTDVTVDDIEQADLIVVYYWKEFREPHMQGLLDVFRRNRHKLLLGICSHTEIEGQQRDQVVDFLKGMAAGIFVNSMFLYNEFSTVFEVPVFYTPNGVDAKFFAPGEKQENSEKLYVGWAGSLTNHQNIRGYHDFIVPAVESVDGVELISAIREQKWHNRQEMLGFYNSIDVYICASSSEGTPNPCLEAASCGVPLITTRVGNMPELVQHGVNGFFIERNIDDIAEKLTLLRDNKTLRKYMSASILKSIENWDWQYQAQNYRIMFDTIRSQNQQDENHLFKTKSQLYLASADRMDRVMDNVRALDGLPSQKIDTYSTVIGGLSGLNYLLALEPENITFFDINPAAIRYAKLIAEMISISDNPRDLISRIFSRSVEHFLHKSGFQELTVENQQQFLNLEIDNKIYSQTLSVLSGDSRQAYRDFIEPYLLENTFDDIRNCCRLLPCWNTNERVPVGGGQSQGYDEHERLVPNTNTFFYGCGWLASKKNFSRIKEILNTAKLRFIHFDLLKNNPVSLGDFSGSIVLHASNIDDWFPQQWAQRVNLLVTNSLKNQGFLALITTNAGVLVPDIDPHAKALNRLEPYVFGKVVEVTTKVPWGFHEFDRDNVDFNQYLATDYLADTTILHILIGEGLTHDVFISVYKKALKNSKRVIVLEHNRDSNDWKNQDNGNFISIDSLKTMIEEINKKYQTVIVCADRIAGQTDLKRNIILVVDKYPEQSDKVISKSRAVEHFLKATEEFETEQYDTAIESIKKYQSLMDYSKLPRKISSDKDNIDVSVIIVTYRRTRDLKYCLETLTNQDSDKYEIIVVDNGGTNYEVISRHVDQYIRCPVNFNLSEGRNIGVYFARGRIVAFLDDDALVEPGYISSIKSAFEKYDIFGLRGRTYPKNPSNNYIGTNIYDLGDRSFPTYCNQEGNSAWDRDVYKSLSGMDPLLFGHEGSDLTYRILNKYQAPGKVIYWPDTIIYHNYPTEEKSAAKKILHHRSADYLKYKHNANIFAGRCDIEKYPIPQKQEKPAPAQNISADITQPRSGPKVSIIISCHNSQQYLSSSIESIQNQTVTDWELFLLDDASSDNTKKIIEKFSQIDKRVKPFYFPDNKGPYVRRNFGIERANSDFIIIQDADDIMHPQKIEKLCHEITKDERLGVVGSFYLMVLDEFRHMKYADKVELPLTHQQIMQNYNSQLYICWHGSAIIRKSLFCSIGLYDEHPYGSDKFWLAKAAELARYTDTLKFKNIPEYLTYKIEHTSSQQGKLPTLDPRSRRAKFQTYWLYKLMKIREKVSENPDTDVRTELKNCKCNDYIEKYGHLFEQWERQGLDDNIINGFIAQAADKFNKANFVSCIIALDSIEKICPDISKKAQNYNLIRAMAYYAIDKKERSLEYLKSEIENHKNSAAFQFQRDYFENQTTDNVHTWCSKNSGKLDLRINNAPTLDTDELLVSVIIPAYNAQTYISDAIQSVLIQDYKNFELIIINDGSTDNTGQIVSTFNDDRIRYFNQNNHGLAATHNAGIKYARGRYIIKLDADDMMTSDFISEHIYGFKNHPQADLIYCDDCLVDESGRQMRIIERPEYADRKTLIRDTFRNGFPVVPFRTCINKSVFERIGLFDEKLLIGEDYDMMRRFISHNLNACRLKKPLYLRRMTNDSLSRNFSLDKAECLFEILDRFTRTFSYDELFPDVDWEKIIPQKKALYAKCLTAETYIEIGKSYLRSKTSHVYADVAFKKARQEYEKCLEMEPDNYSIRQIVEQYNLDKLRLSENDMQTVP